jgi:YVTN family beta-propeller protein
MMVGLLAAPAAILASGNLPAPYGSPAEAPSSAASTGPQIHHTPASHATSLVAPSCQLAGNPIYANGTGDVFVICATTGNVVVISASNNTVIASIPIGSGLLGASGIYDPGKLEVFLSDSNNGVGENVSVISVRTDTVVATVDVGSTPGQLLYDPGASEVFVQAAAGVVVISDTNNSVVANIHAGYGGDGLAYAPGTGEVFLAYADSNSVAVISDRSFVVLARIAVGPYPGDMSYGGGYVAVVDSGSNEVSVMTPIGNQVVATIRVGASPSLITFDSGRSEFFVSNFDSSNVSVIDARGLAVAATIPTFPYPTWMTYVAATGTIYLQNFPGLGPNAGGYNLTVISDRTDRVTGVIPVEDEVYGVAYDPQADELFVPTVADVAVGPCGVASDYTVNIVSTESNSTLASIPVGRSPAYYCVNFTETGFDFAAGAEWCFDSPQFTDIWTCSTVPGTAPVGTLPNGTYTYSIWSTQPGQSAVTPTVSFTVRGAPVNLNLTFVAASPVTFTADGLPSGTSWSVAINGTVTLANGSRSAPFELTGTSAAGSELIVVSLPNGTYNYSASASWFDSVQGSTTISGLQPVRVVLAFSPARGPRLLGQPIAVWVLAGSFAVGAAVVAVAIRGRRRRDSGRA